MNSDIGTISTARPLRNILILLMTGAMWISVNDGAYTLIAPIGDYPKDFRYLSGSGNPVTGPQPGAPCYAGIVTLWTEAAFDLSAYAGSTVQFRWRFSTDAGTTREGWCVDDIRVVGAPIAVGATADD
ncbi:MAG: immune inhibitor A [bacterium]|nr:immune inhibitor A [bacterium]